MPDNSLIVLQHLINRGLAPHQAAGLVGRFQQESGRGLNTGAVGDAGISFGIGQWNRDRRQNLYQFAASQGRSVTDPTLQADFALHEMKGSEKFAGDMLMRARNVEEASKAAMHFERPSGYTQSTPELGHGYSNTLKNAAALAGLPPGAIQQANASPGAGTPGASQTPVDLPSIAGMTSPFDTPSDDSLGGALAQAAAPADDGLTEAPRTVDPAAYLTDPRIPKLAEVLTAANAEQAAPATPVLDETAPLFNIKNIGQAKQFKPRRIT